MERQKCMIINQILLIMSEQAILTHEQCVEISNLIKKYDLCISCQNMIEKYDEEYKQNCGENKTNLYYS